MKKTLKKFLIEFYRTFSWELVLTKHKGVAYAYEWLRMRLRRREEEEKRRKKLEKRIRKLTKGKRRKK